MFQIDDATAVPVEPTPAAPGTPGFFTDGDLLAGIRATVLTADWANTVQDELIALLTAAGITPAKATRNQVLTAIETLIEARAGNYAIDTGAANAYVVALSPPITSYTQSFPFAFRAVHSNTGASTVNFGGGVVPLDRDDGTAMQNGDIGANSIVMGAYDFVANKALVSGIVLSQLGALAKENFGNGLQDDGTGGATLKLADSNSLRVSASGVQGSSATTDTTTTQLVHAAQSGALFVLQADTTFTIDRTATALWNGFYFDVNAKTGAATLVPDSHDSVGGLAAGTSYTLAQGQSARIVSDGAGNLNVSFLTAVPGASPAPQYVNTSQTVGSGQYDVDASSGVPIVLTIATGQSDGSSMRFIDGDGSWRGNPVTLTPPGGETIMGLSSFVLNTIGADMLFKKKASKSDWRIQ